MLIISAEKSAETPSSIIAQIKWYIFFLSYMKWNINFIFYVMQIVVKKLYSLMKDIIFINEGLKVLLLVHLCFSRNWLYAVQDQV